MATASDKGTLIRIFSTEDGLPLQEVRRGTDKAEIYSIAFDRQNKQIACSSDKGTIHIFNVQKGQGKIELSDENAKEEDLIPKSEMIPASSGGGTGGAGDLGDSKKPKNSKHV